MKDETKIRDAAMRVDCWGGGVDGGQESFHYKSYFDLNTACILFCHSIVYKLFGYNIFGKVVYTMYVLYYYKENS